MRQPVGALGWGLVALMLAPGWQAAWEGTARLECGSFAPFATSCGDCCVAMRTEAESTTGTLLFVGSVTTRLMGANGSLVWRCEAWLLESPPAPLPATKRCTGPVAAGEPLVPGESLSLACVADVVLVPQHRFAVGPAGPWGCKVTLR